MKWCFSNGNWIALATVDGWFCPIPLVSDEGEGPKPCSESPKPCEKEETNGFNGVVTSENEDNLLRL